MRSQGKHPASRHVWQCDILWLGCCCKHVERQASSDLSFSVSCHLQCSGLCGDVLRFQLAYREHHPSVVVFGCEEPCSCCQDCALRGHWEHMLPVNNSSYIQQKVPCSAQWEERVRCAWLANCIWTHKNPTDRVSVCAEVVAPKTGIQSLLSCCCGVYIPRWTQFWAFGMSVPFN